MIQWGIDIKAPPKSKLLRFATRMVHVSKVKMGSREAIDTFVALEDQPS